MAEQDLNLTAHALSPSLHFLKKLQCQLFVEPQEAKGLWEDDDRDGEGWGDLEPSDNWDWGWGHRAVEKGGLSAKERNRGQNARTGEPARPSGDWWAGR